MKKYFNGLADLWEGFRNFIDKCSSEKKITLIRPTLNYYKEINYVKDKH